MKILHIYKTYFPDSYGGIEEVVKELCTGLNKSVKAEIFVLSAKPKEEPFYCDGIRVHQTKTDIELASTPFSINAIKKFKGLAPQFDLLHFHYPFPYGDLILKASGVKTPYIVTYHSDIVRQKFLKHIYRPLEISFLNKAQLIICTSTQYLNSSKNLKKFKYKTTPINLGLSDKSLRKDKVDVSNEIQRLIKSPFFLFLGALRKYKGIDVLLEAAKSVDAEIIIAGGGDVNHYKKFIHKHNLNNVRFLGEVDDDTKTILLDACYALILPSNSRNEAFGLVQLEAAMRSKPLICTELGTGTSFVNEHESTGIVIKPNDHKSLINAINFLVLHPVLAQEMGKAARRRYEALFSSKRMCDEYLKIYTRLIKKL